MRTQIRWSKHLLAVLPSVIFLGLGFCCIYVPSVVIVGHYFQIRRQLAMGLAAAGFGAGNFIFAPILRYFIECFGWRGAMVITSGICLNCCVLGALLMPVQFWSKEKTYHPKDIALFMTQSKELVVSDKEKENIFNLELLKDIKFLIFLANNILWNVGSLILLVICSDFAYKHGVSKDSGAMLVSTVGLCSLIGRIVVAFLGGHQKVNRFYIFIASTAVSGLAIGCFPISPDYIAMLSASAIYGLAFGTQVGVLAVVTVELFGVQKLTSAYGYLMFGNGAGAMMGPPIAGMYKSILIAPRYFSTDNVYNFS